MALVIGVAGSIAAGKSLVCQMLVELGAAYTNGDTMVHRLYDPGTPGFERVVAEFGADVVGPDGFVDRKALGGKVFGDPAAMRRLTTAMGDIAGAFEGEIDRWRRELPPGGLAVIEAVNLLEAGYGRWCDQNWLVAVDPPIAKQRLIARNGFTEDEAEQRLRSQRPWEERAAAVDAVILNNGDLPALRGTVEAETDRIRRLHAEGDLPPTRFLPWWEEFRAKIAARTQ